MGRRTALTGGIGSGKSYVCRLLRERGIEVYDCDAAAKRLMRHDEQLKERLRQLVGPDLYEDGRLNKARMAQFMLSSEENIRRVNAIVHPAVGDDFLASGAEWMECAILFESGFDRYVDRVVCVSAPLEVRLQRVMERDHLSREKVMEWMRKQWPQEEVMARSNFVIVNDGVAPLEEQIDRLLDYGLI